MVVHACNHNTRETGAGGSLYDFKLSLTYTMSSRLAKATQEDLVSKYQTITTTITKEWVPQHPVLKMQLDTGTAAQTGVVSLETLLVRNRGIMGDCPAVALGAGG